MDIRGSVAADDDSDYWAMRLVEQDKKRGVFVDWRVVGEPLPFNGEVPVIHRIKNKINSPGHWR